MSPTFRRPQRTTVPQLAALLVALSLTAVLPGQAPSDKLPEKASDDSKQLLGTWEGFAVEGKGDKPDAGPIKIQLTITEGKMSAVDLKNDNKDMGNGTFKLDSTKSLKQLDATGVVLPGKRERTFLGIYELDGDTLKWCVDNRGQARPEEFRTGAGNYLLILKRKK